MPNSVWFTTFTQHLVESLQVGGNPDFPAGCRYRAEQCLEHILVNPLALHDHIRVLFKLLSPLFPYQEPLPEPVRNKVPGHGLGGLNDGELYELILSPMALMGLSYDIEQFAPARWLDIVEREVKCEVQRKQRRHKRLQQMFDSFLSTEERQVLCGSKPKTVET